MQEKTAKLKSQKHPTAAEKIIARYKTTATATAATITIILGTSELFLRFKTSINDLTTKILTPMAYDTRPASTTISWITYYIILLSIYTLLYIYFHKINVKFALNLQKALRNDLVESINTQIRKQTNEEIDKILQESHPPAPPHALTNQIAPKDGQYYSQSYPEVTKAFKKGQKLPYVKLPQGRQTETVWIYQEPPTERPDIQYPV